MIVKFLGQDIVDYLIETPDENIQMSLDIVTDQESIIKLNNDNSIWLGGSTSILNGINWKGERVHIYNDDYTILDGIVTGGSINGNVFELKVQGRLAMIFEKLVVYQNTDTNPAKALLAILEGFGYDDYIDYPSFYRSSNVYDNLNVSIGVYYYPDTGATFKAVCDELSAMGSAYMFMQDNKIHFQVYEAVSGTPLYSITESDMLDYPKQTSTGIQLVYNDYSVDYFLSNLVPATDSGGSKYGQVTQGVYNEARVWARDFGKISRIQCNNITTAHGLGGLRMLRDRWDKNRLSFNMRLDLYPLSVGQVYKITSADHGWDEKNCRLFGIQKNEKKALCLFEEIK